MSSKLSTLAMAIAGAAPLIVLGAGAHAQTAENMTRTCHFTSGARAGAVVDFSNTPGTSAVAVGARCGDMTGSNGVAVAQQPGSRLPGAGRFYRTPGAPSGLDDSGRLKSGYTQSCRFSSGPRAGSTVDFSNRLGATPIQIGNACSDGTSQGVGVAPGK